MTVPVLVGSDVFSSLKVFSNCSVYSREAERVMKSDETARIHERLELVQFCQRLRVCVNGVYEEMVNWFTPSNGKVVSLDEGPIGF